MLFLSKSPIHLRKPGLHFSLHALCSSVAVKELFRESSASLPTCVADLEALFTGRMIGGPAQEQPVARAGEVGGFRVVPAQDCQEGALAGGTWQDRETEAA